jgi:hypothetical protein
MDCVSIKGVKQCEHLSFMKPPTSRPGLRLPLPSQMREYFNEHHLAPPPLPQDVLELVPCSLSATETQTNAGKIGRLIIAKLDGVVLYESEWTIAPA